MGKKSSQKKQKKENVLKEKKAREIITSTDSQKANASTDSQAQTPRFSNLPQKALAMVLMIGGLIALAFFAIFIWGELTRPPSIAKFIPQDAAGFIEFETNLEGKSWQDYYNLTQGKTFPSIAQLIEKINTTFNVDMMKDVYPWLARRAGIAMLRDKKAALFLEIRNEEQALNFFRQHRLASITEDLQTSEIEGVKTYHYIASSPIALAILGNYLVVASDDSAIRQIIQATNGKYEVSLGSKKMDFTGANSLFTNRSFQRINNAVPQKNRLGFAFMRPGQLIPMISSLPMSFGETFTKDFIAEGGSIKALDTMLVIEHLALFTKKNNGEKISDVNRKKYQATLMDTFSDKTQLFVGGEDVGRMSDILDRVSSDTISYIRSLIKNTFDGEVSMEEMQTLLKDEYALALDDGQWKMAIELTNQEEQEKIIKKMIHGIESSRVFFQPTIENDTIKGSTKIMKSSNVTYENVDIRATEVDGEPRGVYVAIHENKAIITVSMDAMHRAIDTLNGKRANLKNSKSYTNYIKPLLQSADDVIYARPREMEPMLPAAWKFLSTISEISLATNSFEDAMKTILFISP